MDSRFNRHPTILIALVVVFAIACNTVIPTLQSTPPTPLPISTPTLVPQILHYENDVVAFDYPAGLRVFLPGDPAFVTYPLTKELGGELVIGLADPNWIKDGILYSSIGVYRHSIPPGSNLETIIQKVYKQEAFQTEVVESSAPVTFAGLPAYQRVYCIAWGPLWYMFRDTWIEKEGQVLRLSIWEETYAINFQFPADTVANSFVIKENLLPLVETPSPEPTLTPTPFPASMLHHFENDVLAFDYLEGLNIYKADDSTFRCDPNFQLGGELVVGLADLKFIEFDRHQRSIRIFHEKMQPNSNLESIMLEAYQKVKAKFPREEWVEEATGVVTVSGLSGL